MSFLAIGLLFAVVALRTFRGRFLPHLVSLVLAAFFLWMAVYSYSATHTPTNRSAPSSERPGH